MFFLLWNNDHMFLPVHSVSLLHNKFWYYLKIINKLNSYVTNMNFLFNYNFKYYKNFLIIDNLPYYNILRLETTIIKKKLKCYQILFFC